MIAYIIAFDWNIVSGFLYSGVLMRINIRINNNENSNNNTISKTKSKSINIWLQYIFRHLYNACNILTKRYIGSVSKLWFQQIIIARVSKIEGKNEITEFEIVKYEGGVYQ